MGVSLSARRAWIEISAMGGCISPIEVALRKESVDRNIFVLWMAQNRPLSLSARRAWIEMLTDDVSTGGKIKSLSARRAWIEICGGAFARLLALCRSPQGERG